MDMPSPGRVLVEMQKAMTRMHTASIRSPLGLLPAPPGRGSWSCTRADATRGRTANATVVHEGRRVVHRHRLEWRCAAASRLVPQPSGPSGGRRGGPREAEARPCRNRHGAHFPRPAVGRRSGILRWLHGLPDAIPTARSRSCASNRSDQSSEPAHPRARRRSDDHVPEDTRLIPWITRCRQHRASPNCADTRTPCVQAPERTPLTLGALEQLDEVGGLKRPQRWFLRWSLTHRRRHRALAANSSTPDLTGSTQGSIEGRAPERAVVLPVGAGHVRARLNVAVATSVVGHRHGLAALLRADTLNPRWPTAVRRHPGDVPQALGPSARPRRAIRARPGAADGRLLVRALAPHR